ncbi:Tetratricopeptide repeat protein 28 [Stylophora pistillata]|uniref:Tetratricopeptide repeat protein 28 n=1 Tax=Stylophora pistillata TaxID=50429 RepID=A0A2B4SBS2_STYPI|nr:Tetratricopeptide repeat protein 28 [Stylophora pistillata]
MDDVDKISWALFIAIAMASVLLQTCRYKKAVEIFSECLVLLKQFKTKKSTAFSALVFHRLFDLYCLVGDTKNAIKNGEEAICIHLQNSDFSAESRLIVGKLLRRLEPLYDFPKPKDYFGNELGIWIETVASLKEAGDRSLIMLGEALNDLGKYYEILEDFQNAKRMKFEALEVSKYTGNVFEEIMIYRNLGDIHTSLKEFPDAENCYARAVSISRELGDKRGEAFTYNGLREFYHRQSNYAMAEKYARKSLEVYTGIGDKENEATLSSELGNLCHFRGRYEEALEFHQRSFDVYKKTGDKIGEGQQYGNLSAVYKSMGDIHKAKQYLEQALAINKKMNITLGQGIDYGNLGTIYQQLGDLAKAKECHEEALKLKEGTGLQDTIPSEYHHLGISCKNDGEYVQAKKHFEKGLKMARELGERSLEGSFLSDLGEMESITGESEKGKTYYEEALQIFEKVGDIAKKASTLRNLASVYRLDGDLRMAESYLKSSLGIIKQIGNKNEESAVLGTLGDLYYSQGEYERATYVYQQGLSLAKETSWKRVEANIHNSLGSCYVYQKDFQKAKTCFQQALSYSEMMEDLRGTSICCCNIASVYFLTQDFENVWLYLKRSIKALEEAQTSIGESEYYKIGFVDKHDGPYQFMVTTLITLGNFNQALSVVELVRARSLAELMVKRYSAPPLPDLDSSQLTDFRHFVRDKNKSCLSFCFVQGDLLFCWSLRAKRETMVRAVKTEDFPVNIRPQDFDGRSPAEPQENPQFEQSQNTCQVEEKNEGGSNKEPPLKVLYKVIIAPNFLEGSEIIVVPDRSLYRVPFSALMNEKGEFLAERFRIRYAPSLTTLRLIRDSPEDYHSETGVLIVGDPDVGTVTHQGSELTLPRLPKAKEEAEIVGKILNVQPLTGKEATKEAVLQKIHSVSLIHIAAHGEEERGNIALAPSNREKDDFLLTMADISAVRLRAKLVVLSCCQSGKGHIKGEGVVGIARAFLGSGARSVLASLWAVDDEATMEFMKQF